MPIHLRGLSDRRLTSSLRTERPAASVVLGLLLGICPPAAFADGAGVDRAPEMPEIPPVLVPDRARPAGPTLLVPPVRPGGFGAVAAGHQAPQPLPPALSGLPGAAAPADLWRAVSVAGGEGPVPAVTVGGDTDGATSGAMPVVSSVFVARRETPFIDRVNRLKLKAGSGEENIWLLGLGWRVDFAGGGR